MVPMAVPLPPMLIEGILHAQPVGRFDFTALEPILAALPRGGGGPHPLIPPIPLIIDLSQVTALTSSGIGVIMKLHQDTRLVLAAAPSHLREVMTLAGVDRLVALAPTVEEARSRFARPRGPGRP